MGRWRPASPSPPRWLVRSARSWAATCRCASASPGTSTGYPDLEVELAFYGCTLPTAAEPKAIGVAALEWADRGALARYDFCEADLPVLPLIGDVA